MHDNYTLRIPAIHEAKFIKIAKIKVAVSVDKQRTLRIEDTFVEKIRIYVEKIVKHPSDFLKTAWLQKYRAAFERHLFLDIMYMYSRYP